MVCRSTASWSMDGCARKRWRFAIRKQTPDRQLLRKTGRRSMIFCDSRGVRWPKLSRTRLMVYRITEQAIRSSREQHSHNFIGDKTFVQILNSNRAISSASVNVDTRESVSFDTFQIGIEVHQIPS